MESQADSGKAGVGGGAPPGIEFGHNLEICSYYRIITEMGGRGEEGFSSTRLHYADLEVKEECDGNNIYGIEYVLLCWTDKFRHDSNSLIEYCRSASNHQSIKTKTTSNTMDHLKEQCLYGIFIQGGASGAQDDLIVKVMLHDQRRREIRNKVERRSVASASSADHENRREVGT